MIQILHRWAIFNPICDGSAFSPLWWWWWWPRWRCALAKSITPSCGVRLLVVRPFRLAFMGFRICSASCPAEPSACWRLMQTYMRAAGDCTASAQQSKKLLAGAAARYAVVHSHARACPKQVFLNMFWISRIAEIHLICFTLGGCCAQS
jgi:hypothetical protein